MGHLCGNNKVLIFFKFRLLCVNFEKNGPGDMKSDCLGIFDDFSISLNFIDLYSAGVH